jgi:hypothetical protein
VYGKKMNLTGYVNDLLSNIKTTSLQTLVHPEILFRYCSLNLLVSRQGVGKTYTIMREMIKLSQLPNFGEYIAFIYVSDKINDDTVNAMIKLIKIRVRHVDYADFLLVLKDLVDAKNAYFDVIEKEAENDVSEETRKDLFDTLDIKEWTDLHHTAILLDDAINILKDHKCQEVRNLLFQNRQPRLTIFLCIQDTFGVPIQIRRNCDMIMLFAGLTDRMAFRMILTQLGINGRITFEEYNKLPYRSALLIDYLPQGTVLKIV